MNSMIKLFTFLTIFILSNELSIAQNHKAKELERNIFSGNLGGTSSLIGINYQRFIGNKMAIELGIGLIGIGAGMTIYPKGLVQKGTRFYTGIKFNSVVLVDVGGGTVAYIPFGVTFFSDSPFIFGFDIGPARGKLISSSFGGQTSETYNFYGFGNLKIGRRF